MGALLAILGRWGVPEPLRKLILFAAIALLVVGVLGVAKCSYDKSVIDGERATNNARQAQADRKADTKAADRRLEDQERLAREELELLEVTREVDDPVERRRAFHRCLRLQQAARAAGGEPPACV